MRLFAQKIQLPFKVEKNILALGGHTKNTLCFMRGGYAYLSGLHADLSCPADFWSFERQARYFLRQNPQVIAYDLHPDYQSTRYALGLSAKRYQLLPVQHHHAHIASCLAENGLGKDKVIGVAFDGTGMGDDGTLWGGEFFICDYQGFERAAHLKELPLIGAEMAIRQPWRLAAFWLYRIFGDDFLKLRLGLFRKIREEDWRVLKRMYQQRFNSPLASSCGRLFDAAACLILNRPGARFEGELAIALEKIASRHPKQDKGYSFRIVKSPRAYLIEPESVFRQIVQELKEEKQPAAMAYAFHLGVAEVTARICLRLRKAYKVSKVALSGGVFQNRLLREMILGLLYREGLQVFTHQALSSSDSSLSLGQAAVAGLKEQVSGS